MKIAIKKAFITVLFLCICQMLFSQQNTDGKFLFKTWFFVEHENTTSRDATKFPLKDSSLFNLFETLIDLKLDTLKSSGFTEEYVFLSVALNNRLDATLQDTSIKYDLKTKYLEYISIPISCENYVLCVNKSSGTSYRIKGFKGNDFFALLREVKEEKSELSGKSFLKNYSVEGIDFTCIYNGLISGEFDTKKYPCLSNCKGSIIWVH